MTYNWKQWQGQVVDGKFPLHQHLGASDHDAVFLTERVRQSPSRTAIKVIPAEFVDASRQLASWKTASSLSHRHLLRMFEHGRSQLDGVDVLYVVMEYADEDLSQILPERPLSPSECKDMMYPVLDVLAYLHSQGLVHAHVMPSNIMASGNEVKISSDTVQAPGAPIVRAPHASPNYEAPEVASSGLSAASDVWCFGATALEAITQNPLTWTPGDSSDPRVPDFGEPLSTIIHNCLRVRPEQRWSVAQVAAALRPVAVAPTQPATSQPAVSSSPVPPAPPSPAARPQKAGRGLLPIVAVIVALAALIGFFLTRTPRSQDQPAQVSSSGAANPAPASAPAQREPAALPSNPPSDKGRVLHQGATSVPSSARNTIHGTVRVNVRVSVSPEGNVTATALETHGPSRYFADIARKSASEWQFSAPTVEGKAVPSEWVLKYEFRRGGTTVVPSQENP